VIHNDTRSTKYQNNTYVLKEANVITLNSLLRMQPNKKRGLCPGIENPGNLHGARKCRIICVPRQGALRLLRGGRPGRSGEQSILGVIRSWSLPVLPVRPLQEIQ
jgi:hypothetical protein